MSDAGGPHANRDFAIEQDFAAKLMERFRLEFVEKVSLTIRLGGAYLDRPTEENRTEIQDCVHRLAGIAGALGRADISVEAGKVDLALGSGAPEAEAQLASLLMTLKAALQA